MMDSGQQDDARWRAALDWVMAQHESPDDASLRAGLAAWLAEDPSHRAAYEEARRVWLLTGLVPPLQPPADDGDDDSESPLPPHSTVQRR